MLAKLGKNVVCIKNIPSNLIEEAFFILKDIDESDEIEYGGKRRELALKEIDEMTDEYTKTIKVEIEKERERVMKLKNKLLKIKIISLLIACTFLFLLLLTIKS